MATDKQKKNPTRKYKLDSKEYMDKVNEARRMAHEALKHYGKPTMSLEELRALLDRDLKGISLSDWIIEDREKGF